MLKIEKFRLYANQQKLLDIPNLSVETGQFVSIQGANSTGKTLFLNTLNGEYTDYLGEISLKKQTLDYHLKQNSIILIDNRLPVIENISFLDNIQIPFGSFSSAQKSRLLEMVNILNCIDLLNVKMVHSSKAERVIMYLLRAAMISPSLLLIDDLDSYFDNDMLIRVHQFILFCIKSGIIIVATSKDARLMNIGSNHIYRIKDGELSKI